MDLVKIFRRFPDHESCIEHLEKVRFGDEPYCPNCGGNAGCPQGGREARGAVELP